MSEEVVFEGETFISSKRASEISGYKQDYIGQLARGSKIQARRVGGMWYVSESSLLSYKTNAENYTPVPPASVTTYTQDTSVELDGTSLISARRASELTAYNPDYVGQLAREGAIRAKQISGYWYVDIRELQKYKAQKDSLLAAVQSESVGIRRFTNVDERDASADTHFSYFSELNPLVPERVGSEQNESQLEHNRDVSSIRTKVPIRVVQKSRLEPKDDIDRSNGRRPTYIPGMSRKYIVLSAVIFVFLLAFTFNFSYFQRIVRAEAGENAFWGIPSSIGGLFSVFASPFQLLRSDLEYQRGTEQQVLDFKE